MEMAARHAKYQADHRTQGHQLWDKRVKELFQTMGQYAYAKLLPNLGPNKLKLVCWNLEPKCSPVGKNLLDTGVLRRKNIVILVEICLKVQKVYGTPVL
jgi:hypothetical protein